MKFVYKFQLFSEKRQIWSQLNRFFEVKEVITNFQCAHNKMIVLTFFNYNIPFCWYLIQETCALTVNYLS
jgi:hypothetical protein